MYACKIWVCYIQYKQTPIICYRIYILIYNSVWMYFAFTCAYVIYIDIICTNLLNLCFVCMCIVNFFYIFIWIFEYILFVKQGKDLNLMESIKIDYIKVIFSRKSFLQTKIFL